MLQVRQFNQQVQQGTDMQSVVLSEEEAAPSGHLDTLIARSTFQPLCPVPVAIRGFAGCRGIADDISICVLWAVEFIAMSI